MSSDSTSVDSTSVDDAPADASPRELLLHRIEQRSVCVAVLGLGHVGLPITAAMVDAGFRVLGVDVDAARVAALNAGATPLRHLGEDLARRLRDTGRFEATTDTARLAEADAALVCVPTPLDAERQPDLGAVRATAGDLARHLRPGGLVVLSSTTWPGTTRSVLVPMLEAAGRRCGTDVFVAFSPERADPGRHDDAVTIPRLVGGVDEASGEIACALYRAAVREVVPVASADVAEAAKLLENCYRAVNIAMVNELKLAFEALGVDVWDVLDAASTKPFGFQRFEPGPGLGGHCIPVDPFYLAWAAERAGASARLVRLAGEINQEMPERIVERVGAALAEDDRTLEGASVLVLGVAYKPDIDDVRGSPSFALIHLLEQAGAKVDYHDPHVPRLTGREHEGVAVRASVELDDARLAACDAVLVATAHAAVDHARVARIARLIVDTRGVLRGGSGPEHGSPERGRPDGLGPGRIVSA